VTEIRGTQKPGHACNLIHPDSRTACIAYLAKMLLFYTYMKLDSLQQRKKLLQHYT